VEKPRTNYVQMVPLILFRIFPIEKIAKKKKKMKHLSLKNIGVVP
jgi:hypothetical protein